jgi:hypothetical protein
MRHLSKFGLFGLGSYLLFVTVIVFNYISACTADPLCGIWMFVSTLPWTLIFGSPYFIIASTTPMGVYFIYFIYVALNSVIIYFLSARLGMICERIHKRILSKKLTLGR